MENPKIALLAGNGKHISSDERAGTPALNDKQHQLRDKCSGVLRTEDPMWG